MKGTEQKDQSHGEIIVQQTNCWQSKGMYLNFKQTHYVYSLSVPNVLVHISTFT